MLQSPTITCWKHLWKTCHCTLSILFCRPRHTSLVMAEQAPKTQNCTSSSTRSCRSQALARELPSPGMLLSPFKDNCSALSLEGRTNLLRANQHSDVHTNPSALLGAYVGITATEKDVTSSKGSRNLHKTGLRPKNYVPALPCKQDDSPLTDNISCFRRRPRPGLLRGLCTFKLLCLPQDLKSHFENFLVQKCRDELLP